MLLHLVALDKFIFIFITKTVNTNNLDGVNMEIINEKHSILENHQQEDSIFNQIDELVNKNELDEAILLIDLIPESSPNFGKALFIKSMILGFLGKDTESVEKLKDSINVQFGDKSGLFDLNNPEDLFDFGITNFYFGDYHKAIECFDMTLGILPEQSEVIYYKALSFGCLGEFRKAIDVIDEAIKLNPENSSYWNDKGAFLSELNRVAAAHKCFNKSIQLNPDSYNWSNKAVLYHKCNDLQQALECYGNAMKLGRIMDSLKKKGYTIIVADHRFYYLNGRLDKILFMEDGKLTVFDNEEKFKKSGYNTRSFDIFSLNITFSESVREKNVVAEMSDVSYKNILHDINIKLYKNEVVGLVGKNGVGKTTFAKLLCDSFKPDIGKIKKNNLPFLLCRIRIISFLELRSLMK